MACRPERRSSAARAFARRAAFAFALPLLLPAAAHADDLTYRQSLTAARKLIASGDLKGAEAEMKSAVKLFPDNPDVHILLAQIYLQLDDSPAAEEEARLARWHNGDDEAIAPVLAEAMLEQDKMSQLIRDVPPGEREPNIEAIVRRSLGEAHIALGDVAVGQGLLKDAIRLDPDSEQSHVGLGRLHLVQGDLAGAERELAAAEKTAPTAIDVLRLEADIMRTRGDMKGALAAYDKAVAAHPGDLTLLVGRAMILIALNRFDDAQKDVNHALDEAPFSLTPNFLSGVLLAHKGDLKGADDALTGISASLDSLPNGYYLLGSVKYLEGQYDSAIFYLAQYVARRPDDLPARLVLAQSALKKGDPNRAVQVLGPVVYVKAPDPRAVSLLAQAYVAAGNNDDAVRLYEQEAQAKPDSARSATEAAMAQLGLGDPNAGTEALSKIVNTDSGLAQAGPVFILNELRLGRLDSADDAASRLVATEKDNPNAALMLSLVRMAELRYDDAERMLRDILAHNPNFVPGQYNLAQLYRDTGRGAQAKAIYTAILERQPTDQTSLRGMAAIAIADGDRAGAVQWLQKAQDADPADPSPSITVVELETRAKDWPAAIAAAHGLADRFASPRILDILAATLAQSGDLHGAIEVYNDYLAHNDGTLDIYRSLASYQRRAGDLNGARTSLQSALSVQPDDEAAMTALVEVDEKQNGADEAVNTARSFSVRAPELSDLLAANVLARAGRLDEAISLLRKGQVYHPSPRNAGRIAELTWDQGRHDQAKQMLRDILAKNDDPEVRLALADMDMRDGSSDEALTLYQQVVVEAPNDALALNNLATLYEAKSDPRAFVLALQAYRLAPSPQTADTLGWALVRNGDPKKAAFFLEQAANALPQALEIQYHFAVALQGSGALDRAKSLLERIVSAKAAFTGKDDAERRLEALQRG